MAASGLCGVLPVFKPPGMTSHDVVAYLRRLLGISKVGHCGTLDPLACGVLPVCFGTATAIADHIGESPKAYRAEFDFTVSTDTLDFGGAPERGYSADDPAVGEFSRGHASDDKASEAMAPLCLFDNRDVGSQNIGRCFEERIADALKSFVGTVWQKPPAYAAVKIAGKKLYEYARKGVMVDAPPRKATFWSIELIRFDRERSRATVDIRCSKGAYIRALCRDVGEELGRPAALSFLQRTESCGFRARDAFTLDEIERANEDGRIASLATTIGEALRSVYVSVDVGEAQGARFCNGVSAATRLAREQRDEIGDRLVSVFGGGRFLGIGRATAGDKPTANGSPAAGDKPTVIGSPAAVDKPTACENATVEWFETSIRPVRVLPEC